MNLKISYIFGIVLITVAAGILPAAAAGVWLNETVDAQGSVGEFASLAFNNTFPAISYYDGTHGHLKYAWMDENGWHTTTVDAQPLVGKWASLAFNGMYPAISYYDEYMFSLKYAWMDENGWHTTTIDMQHWAGEYTSLAFNGGYPAISYHNRMGQLKFAWQNTTGWYNISVDADWPVGEYNSLAFNTTYPAISYLHWNNQDLKFAWQNTTGWHTVTVDAQGQVGYYTSLAFNGGCPAISYHDATNSDLKYAWQEAGEYAWQYPGTWHKTTVDAQGNVGWHTSLAFNGGYPAISYFDATNSDLKYAWQDADGWHTATVDAQGAVGGFTSLAFNNTYPAISYYDQTNHDLKYAWWVPAGNLTITSVPDGAWIFLDGANTTGLTNTTIHDLLIGTYNVTVQKDWYAIPANATIDILEGATGTVHFDLVPLPPVAGFTAIPIHGAAPLTEQFNDTSLGVLDAWLWEFGDGQTSIEQNPVHIYATVGLYTVRLTVSNAGGSDTEVKYAHIAVALPPNPSGGGYTGNDKTMTTRGPNQTAGSTVVTETPTPVPTKTAEPTIITTAQKTEVPTTEATEEPTTTASPLLNAPILALSGGLILFLRKR